SGIVGTDETQNAAWFFNVNDPTSPMYRQAVKGLLTTLDLGVQAYGSASELLRVFTGRVSSVTLDHAAGTVALDVVDLAADWDVLPAIPSVVTVPPFNAGLTSEFVLDLIARSMPVSPRYSWPAIRPNCIVAAGLRTSLWPEVGTLDTAYSQPIPSFIAGPYGSWLSDFDSTGTLSNYITWDCTLPAGAASVYVEFLVCNVASGGAINLLLGSRAANVYGGQTRYDVTGLSINVTNTKVSVAGDRTLASISTTLGDGAHKVAFAGTYNFSTWAWSGTLYLDGQSQAFTEAQLDNQSPDTFNLLGVSVAGAGIAGLQVTSETAPTYTNFAPTAIIDSSLSPLQVPPPIDAGAQAWDVIQQIAAAELGYARFDGAGNFRFSNRDTLQQQTAFRQVRSDSSLKTLRTVVGDFTEYQRVQVDYSDWWFKKTATVLAPQGAWKIPAGTTQTFLRDLGDTVAAQVLSPVQPWTTDGQGGEPSDKTASYYRASRDKYGNTEHGYGTLSVTVETITPSRIAVTVQNSGGYDAWLVSPANYINLDVGSPALWVRGTPVVTDSPTIVEATYDPNGALYPAPTNPYRQDRDTAQTVAQYLLQQLHAAIPDYPGVEIIPDPRIEVGDKITLMDPDLSKAASMDVIVWGSSVNFGSGAWSQSLNVRAIAPPGAWLLGVAGASELGDGAGTVGTAYLY
ncbi:MAG TPA: hypothetical protein VFH56_06100, partial [Acidimicrobiales bacterium]|nr:hypothetical protein [Acidimicrobiales bacterium]